ncbi:MAG: amidohydrolase [Oscillospiraceae bacterium]|jgi:amidohydrolase|nr:amidohydrolase [Oscillospiraceae bacterium]
MGVEQEILRAIDENREEILAFARDVYRHPELGYKEKRTAAKVAEVFRARALAVRESLAITGVRADLRPEGASSDVTVALIGELDAVVSPDHPHADPQTGAAHACGHHAQLAGVVGAAFALSSPAVAAHLGGGVAFFAVPAEEYGEVEFKNGLKEQGLLRYGGGKCELIRIGAFDDITVSVTHHSAPGVKGIKIGSETSNGFVSKVIRLRGRGAHAAAAPHLGINALNAASLGLTALAYQRETFQDADTVRVHPILTRGGELVNVIPQDATVEILVRGKHLEAILDADRKVDRSFKAGAMALGAKVEILTAPGYLPVVAAPPAPEIEAAARLVFPPEAIERVADGAHGTGSTDVGDLSYLMPVLNFTTGGMTGDLHSKDVDFFDEETAYIATAKIFALTAYHLLKDGAQAARAARAAYKPHFTKADYIAYMDALEKTETVDYGTEGK